MKQSTMMRKGTERNLSMSVATQNQRKLQKPNDPCEPPILSADSFFGCKFKSCPQNREQALSDAYNTKGCQVCKTQVTDKRKLKKVEKRDLSLYEQDPSEPKLSFCDLVRMLIADPTHPTERMIRGCQVLMPETVFINKTDGKIELMTALDRDRCLTIDTKTRLSDPIKVREKLQTVTQERRKDCEQFGKQKFIEDRTHQPKSTVIQTLKRPENLARKQQQVSNRTGVENKALAIVKYRSDKNPHKPISFL